jgi:chromosome segregation protein
MRTLTTMHVVQFSFWDYQSFDLKPGGTAFLGPNGAGKTSLVDAVQIAMVGGHGGHTHFNAQSVHKDHRSIRDYALGTMRSGDGDSEVISRKREEAISYLTLVFEGKDPNDVVSAGICLHATLLEKNHRPLGLFIVPGVRLKLGDHLGALDDSGKAPLEWSVFEAQLRRMAKQAGRTPTLTTKPETYLNELLHAIQHKGRTMEAGKFIRTLSHSLRLKNITSVNDFLRGYLVDAQPIDKQGTLKHIKTVRLLVRQIEDVRQQIVRLSDIERRFAQVAAHHRTRALSIAVRKLLQFETVENQVNQLQQDEQTYIEQGVQLQSDFNRAGVEETTLREKHEELTRRLSSDPQAAAPEHARQLREARQETRTERKRTLWRHVLTFREAVTAVAETLSREKSPHADKLVQISTAWEKRAQKEDTPHPGELTQGYSALVEQKGEIETISRADAAAYSSCVRQLSAAEGRMRAAEKGMTLRRNDDAATAMTLFRAAGIECQTVASLVSVKKPEWQGAIEAFLGRNRHALVVDRGREREAVRILRQANDPLYNVTVVQPAHLAKDLGRTPDPQSVGALIIGNHPVALAYLRRILGPMRQVATEEELERHERSLTRDGMLSANGGTRRLHLVPANECLLGVVVSDDDKRSARQEWQKAKTDEQLASQKAAQSKAANDRLSAMQSDELVKAYEQAFGDYQRASQMVTEVAAIEQAALPDHLRKLREQIQSTKADAESASDKRIELAKRHSANEQALAHTRTQLQQALIQSAALQVAHKEATENPDYDAEQAVSLYQRLFALAEQNGPQTAMSQLENDEKTAQQKLLTQEPGALTEFSGFINEHGINLVEERSNWRTAAVWTHLHHRKLVDSTLAQYEKEANEARDAANQSFRADVAFRMREAIKRVGHDIDDLNRILKTCPEFTGGEKYWFTAVPSVAHRELYDLIQGSALVDAGSAPLFESGDEVQQKLVRFLEACEQGTNRLDNPLEDYRLLFNFDLEIRVGDKKVDTLSKRLGVGSNGEHLVPFYVIAGASLANAYRIKSGEPHDGAAVMIVDEAFHGFDAQNTYVTAQFLKSLGLQLVMAAPDTEVGKLVPVLDSYQDLERSGAEVFVSEIIVKEHARALLESDMPSRNPHLVPAMMKQLSVSAGP